MWSSYKMQPRDHRSAVWSYGFSSTSSGDMYSGVPLMEVRTKVETLMALANLQRHLSAIEKFVNTVTLTKKRKTCIDLPKVTQFHHTIFS